MQDQGLISLADPAVRDACADGCEVPADVQCEELVADWPLARLMLRREAIDRERSWNAVKRDHTVMVNLGSGGRFAVEVGDVSALYTPAPGDLSVLPAGRTFVGMFQGRTLDCAVWMMPAATLDRLAAGAGLPAPVELGVRLSHRDEFLYRSIERLAALVRTSDPFAPVLADGINRSIALHLATVYDGIAGAAPAAALPDAVAAALVDHVEACLSGKITVEELATVAGVSPHALLTGFRARFGRSPLQYVIEQRLNRARRLLAETGLPIAEIAYEVGLSSQSHLTNLFRSRFGVTPAAFRRAPR
jgi:AraC family transcriptional regulator